MARDAGVLDVHAAYGTVHMKEEYELLRAVTHWSKEDVEREKKVKKTDVKPSIELPRYLSEIVNHISFVPFSPNPLTGTTFNLEQQIEIWKKTVDVQQHFNEIEMKIRNLFITFLGAIVAATTIIIDQNFSFPLNGKPTSLAVVLLIASLPVIAVIYFMDRHWYHRLLYGAVKSGMEIEKRLQYYGLEIGLTDNIGKESPIYFAGRKIRSTGKIDLIYSGISSVIVFTATLLINGIVAAGVAIAAIAFFVGLFFSFDRDDRDQ